jgi:hypothetical protein
VTEFLREYGPRLERLYGCVATVLIKLMTFKKKSLGLPLEFFPKIVHEWEETWKLEEAALELLGKAITIIGTELTIIQKEEREPTHEENEVLRKHFDQVSFCFFII